MASSMTLSEIPSLNKTNAIKHLSLAIRESQNAPRATYKAHARPSWWVTDTTVVLADGNVCSVSPFKNPRDMSIPAVKAALHLYIQSMENVEDKTEDSIAADNSSETRAHVEPVCQKVISEDTDEVNDNNPVHSAENNSLSTNLRTESCKEEAVISDSNAIRLTEDKHSLLDRVKNKDAKERDEESTVRKRIKPLTAKNVTVTLNEEVSTLRNDTSDLLRKKRLDYIRKLREKKSALARDFEAEAVRKVEQLAKMETELLDDLNTRLGRLDMWYAKKTVDIPSALLSTAMSELVKKYGMSKEQWLHENVAQAVEQALKIDRSKCLVSDKTRNLDDTDASETSHEDIPRHIPKTPLPYTPAARKRIEKVHDTISKTVRRMRKENEHTVPERKALFAEQEHVEKVSNISLKDTSNIERNITSFIKEFKASTGRDSSKKFIVLFIANLKQEGVFEEFLNVFDEVNSFETKR